MSCKVSIIVPVYNTEQYLCQCIDSLLNQTLQEIEILVVDDGSTDNSWELLKEISSRTDKIKLFRKENGGQGSARNLALDQATGEYVLFVDSDDWVSLEMCDILLQSLNYDEVDVLCFNYHLVYSEKIIRKNRISENGVWIGDKGLKAFFTGEITGHVCNKLYKRSLIELNKMRFRTDKKLYEDLLFTIQVLSYAKIVQYISYAPYFYRIRSNSSTQLVDIRMLDQLVMLDKAIAFMKNIGNYYRFQHHVDKMISTSYVDILIRSFTSNSQQTTLYKALNFWNSRVKIKHLNLKYLIVFLCSQISKPLAKWVYEKLITGLYSKIVLNSQIKRQTDK